MEKHDDETNKRACKSTLSGTAFPEQTAEERSRSTGADEGVNAVEQGNDAGELKRDEKRNDGNADAAYLVADLEELLARIGIDEALIHVLEKNGGEGNKQAVDGGHDCSHDGGNQHSAGKGTQSLKSNGEEHAVASNAIAGSAVHTNESGHERNKKQITKDHI